MAFQVGDWVFCEFELQQIDSVDGERVTGVTNGLCQHSSHDLADRCFALSMPVKRLSDAFEAESRRLHREGSSGLNYQDIHRWLVQRWVQACQQADDLDAMTSAYQSLDIFVRSILNKQNIESGYGFPLMRTRL